MSFVLTRSSYLSPHEVTNEKIDELPPRYNKRYYSSPHKIVNEKNDEFPPRYNKPELIK